MTQFDVYRYSGRLRSIGALVDVQSDLLRELATRIVIPAYHLRDSDLPIQKLNPIVEIEGKAYYLATQELTALRTASLGGKIGTLSDERDAIIAAIDMLVTGI